MRVRVITETYSCLRELHIRLADYVKAFEVDGGPTKEERYKKLVAAYNDFFESYYKKAYILS